MAAGDDSVDGGGVEGERKTAHLLQLLDADAPLDAAKLRLEASSGVPKAFRPSVWPLLLLARGQSMRDSIAGAPSMTISSSTGMLPASVAMGIGMDVEMDMGLGLGLRPGHTTDGVHQLLDPRDTAGACLGGARFVDLRAAFDSNGDMAQVIRAELRKSAKSVANARAPRTIERFVAVVGAYIASTSGTLDRKYSDKEVRDMVHIAAPMLEVFHENDQAAFSSFAAVMSRVAPFFTADGLNQAVRDFLMLFKRTLPEVHEVFAEADLNVQLWAPSALRSLLLRQLPNKCAHRLLDSYFARDADDILTFHIHVCVAVLGVMHERDEFNDIEPESLLPRLNDLPASLPMETILNRATAYQLEREAEGYAPTFHLLH